MCINAEAMQTAGTLGWQITNQSVNVGVNFSNANKSTPLSTSTIVQSYLLAVSASCGVALGLNAVVPRLKSLSPNAKLIAGRLVPFAAVATAGALNVFLMRGEEIRKGIDVYPALSKSEKRKVDSGELEVKPLGKSKKAATLAVGETAISRILNATPIMVLPPLILVKLQEKNWMKQRPRMVTPVNLGRSFTGTVHDGQLSLLMYYQVLSSQPRSLRYHLHLLHSRSDSLSVRNHSRPSFMRAEARTGWWSLTVGYDECVSNVLNTR